MLQDVGVGSFSVIIGCVARDEGRFSVRVGHTQLLKVKLYFPLLMSASGRARQTSCWHYSLLSVVPESYNISLSPVEISQNLVLGLQSLYWHNICSNFL